MSIPLLYAKLHPPSLRAQQILRPRLLKLLDQSSHKKLTILSAPSGYGKSTLLCQWLTGRNFPYGWLSLAEADNDPVRFLTYLVAAVQQIDPHLGEGILDDIQSIGMASGSTRSQVEPALTQLLNDFASIDGPFLLILDDYHLIENTRIHEMASFLLDNQPQPLHLVIATRVDPPMLLARLRAQVQLVEVRAGDLCFTADEASTFLNDVMGLALPSDQIAALEQRTEGWIAGLQLAALSMQDQENKDAFIEAFTGSNHYIVDYLLEEVLNHQPEPVREFLLSTSILERMNGALCYALTGRSDGGAMLERLEQRNLFIISLDEQRQWFRYHRLMADVLQSRLQQFHPESVLELHQKASQWFEVNGFIELAIRHAVSAKNLQKAGELIEQNAMSMLMHGELVTLLNWIKPVEEIAEGRPWLCTYKSWALTLTGQLDIAENWLQKSESALTLAGQENTKEIRGHIETIRAYIAEAHGDASQAILHAQKALGLLPESDQAVRSVVIFTLGTAYRLIGDHTKATQALKAARRAARMAGNRYLELGAVFTLADLTFDQGKLHQAFDIYEEALQLASKPRGKVLLAAGMAYFGLGLIYYEWNELKAAEENVQQAIDLCKKWSHFVNLAASFVLLSRLKKAQGDLDQAEQAIHNAEELTRMHSLALRAESWVTAFRVQLWLAQGNLEAAKRWAEESGITWDDGFSYLRDAEYLTLTRVLLATGQYDPVLELTQRLQTTAQAAGRMGGLIETLVLRALAHQAKADFSQALVALEMALSLAQPEDYVRVFLNEGSSMVELLRRAGTQGIEPQFVARLLSEFDRLSAAAGVVIQPLIDPLSDREIEVLHLLKDGFSNSEIANRLIITVGTVKAHTASIYRKLNVNSRTRAVARARALNLL